MTSKEALHCACSCHFRVAHKGHQPISLSGRCASSQPDCSHETEAKARMESDGLVPLDSSVMRDASTLLQIQLPYSYRVNGRAFIPLLPPSLALPRPTAAARAHVHGHPQAQAPLCLTAAAQRTAGRFGRSASPPSWPVRFSSRQQSQAVAHLTEACDPQRQARLRF